LAACDRESGGRAASKPLEPPRLEVVRHPLPTLPPVDVSRLDGACRDRGSLETRDLGGLGLVIAECRRLSDGGACPERGPTGDLGATGCACPMPRLFVVARDGGVESVTDRAGLQRLVAPIESDAEALSYAVAVTGFFVLREGPSHHVDLATEHLDTTFVRREGEDFRVHLFTAKTCGCERDFLAWTDYLVTREGEVRALESELVFTVPGESSCVE